MKIRIIEKRNGKFEFQIKKRLAFDLFKSWVYYGEFNCLQEAKEEMEGFKIRYINKQQKEMLEKIKRVVEVKQV